MSVRDELATAASQVDGISVTSYYRQSLKPGDGFVRLDSRARDKSGIGYVDTWQVWIAIPQDLAQAERWLDEHMTTVAASLEPVMWVTSITPSTLQLGSSQQTNGVIFQGTRESE